LMDSMIQLSICANPEYLCVARAAVRQVAQLSGFEKGEIGQITLAVVEALTNVIRHSYGGPCDEPIIIKFNKIDCANEKTALEIVIRDFGKQVDPKNIEGRDLDDIKPGGVGVHIMQSVMDEVEFKQAQDRGMLLRMIKFMDMDQETNS
jgi:anti-sigma regulatory factor (Ser/Thr protein kinase)